MSEEKDNKCKRCGSTNLFFDKHAGFVICLSCKSGLNALNNRITAGCSPSSGNPDGGSK